MSIREKARHLFTPELVAQPVLRQFDIVKGEQGVLGHIALQGAAFGQADGQQILRPGGVGVFSQAVGHVAAQAVNAFAGFQVDLGRGQHFDAGRAQRRQRGVLEQHSPRDGVGHLEMAQVVRRVKAVKRSVAQLVERQVMLLLWMVVGAQHEHARAGHGADDIVDDARAFEHGFERVVVGNLLDGGAGGDGGAVHAALADPHAGAVGDDGVLERNLGAVGERRDHGRVLAPLPGKAFLRSRVAVRVVQALDVAAHHRLDAEAFDEAVQVHHHAGLVAVGGGQHHAGAVCIGLENRANGAVDLGIHQHHMLAVGDGFKRHMRGMLDGAGDFDDGVDAGGAAQQHRVFGDGRHAGLDGALQLGEGLDDTNACNISFEVGAPGAFERAVGNGGDAHAGH